MSNKELLFLYNETIKYKHFVVKLYQPEEKVFYTISHSDNFIESYIYIYTIGFIEYNIKFRYSIFSLWQGEFKLSNWQIWGYDFDYTK